MSTEPQSSHAHTDDALRTARGIADPVLVRLSTPAAHLLLLAEDVGYDRAGILQFHTVRCCRRARSWKSLLTRSRNLGHHAQVNLRRCGSSMVAAIPGLATVRVPDDRRHVAMITLTRLQYETLRSAPPRRLMQATRLMRLPRPALLRRAFHTVRRALMGGAQPAASR